MRVLLVIALALSVFGLLEADARHFEQQLVDQGWRVDPADAGSQSAVGCACVP